MNFCKEILFVYIAVICKANEIEVIENFVSEFIHGNELERIINGQIATPHSMPYMVAIIKNSNSYDRCGGALIQNKFILTAAQCVDGHAVEVKLGAYDISLFEQQQVRYTIEEKNIKVHPEFNSFTLDNDIALIQLPEEVDIGQNIQTIALADSDSELFIGEPAIFAGWGRAGIFSYSDKLKQMEMVILAKDQCEIDHDMTKDKLCANGRKKSWYDVFAKNSCEGDEGGPLVIRKGSENILIGVASETSPHCSRLFSVSTVFTRISSYRTWIDSEIEEEEDKPEPDTDSVTDPVIE